MCDLLICRICLNSKVKGYKLENHSLWNYYEYVIMQKLNSQDELPQWVCNECAMMLHKYHKFKDKCLQGQRVLQQITLRGKITYESVSEVNRSSENLTSSVGIAVTSKRVKTTAFKFNQRTHIPIIRDSNKYEDINDRIVAVEIKIETTVNEISKVDNDDTNNSSDDIENANEIIEHEVKHENKSVIPIKAEAFEAYAHKHLSDTSGIKSQNTDINKETTSLNENSDIDNADCDSDNDLDITDHANTNSSDDDLLEEVKKRAKVKRKPASETKEPKMKKSKMESDKVELKNTKPKKHFLNLQFWKKISLTEEEAVREFKRREFNNDYYLKAKYKCTHCFKGFSKNDMLERHLKHWHDECSGAVECRFCRMRFRHKHQLVKHMQEHLVLHHCLQCNLHFPRLQAALAHQEHHNGIKRTCEHCGKEFNHLSTYYTHLRMSHKSSHVCVACGASFVSENGLHLHIKFKHFVESEELEEKMRQQREASKTANYQGAGRDMRATIDPDTEEIYCVKCDIKFMSRHAFNIHFFNSKNHDDEEAETDLNKIGVGSKPNSKPKIPTSCLHCHKEFPTRQGYIKHHKAEHPHIPLNIPKKRDICEVCGASVQMGSIQYHMKSHTGERDFACPAPACGMRFTLKYNMKRHYNVKHLGIPAPKYVRRTPGRRRKKTQDILENDFSPFVRTRPGYFL